MNADHPLHAQIRWLDSYRWAMINGHHHFAAAIRNTWPMVFGCDWPLGGSSD